MCVGFIFWDVEINNDFEDITMLAFKVGLSLDMKRLSRMSKSASELSVERILKSGGEI